MAIISCIDCAYDSALMTSAGFETIGVEDYRWAAGHTETEILWGKEESPITEQEPP